MCVCVTTTIVSPSHKSTCAYMCCLPIVTIHSTLTPSIFFFFTIIFQLTQMHTKSKSKSKGLNYTIIMDTVANFSTQYPQGWITVTIVYVDNFISKTTFFLLNLYCFKSITSSCFHHFWKYRKQLKIVKRKKNWRFKNLHSSMHHKMCLWFCKSVFQCRYVRWEK